MPRHLSIVFSSFWLHLLLLLVLMGGGNAAASTGGQEGLSRSLELFKSGTSQVVSRRPGGPGDGTIHSFKGHSLVVVNGVLVALAKAEYKVGRYTEEKMLAKSIDIEKKTVTGRAQAITVGDKGEKWKTELVIEKERAVNRDLPLYGPRAVVKGNEIFVLVMSGNELRRNEPHGGDWNAELYVGDVTTKPEKDGGAITWRAPTSLKETFKAQLAQNPSWINFMFDTGRGIALEDTTIVFPLVGATHSRKKICTVIYSEDGGKNWKFPSRSLISEDCKDSSLIEWDGKLTMITTSDYSARRVYESTDKGKTWVESTGEHAHVLGRFLKEHEASDRVDFLTATINGKSAVLFTQRGEKNDKYRYGYQKVFHLWLYYDRRIYQVGPISPDGVQGYMFGSLLYREGELFFLYEKSDGRNTRSLVLVHLTDQMRRIRSLLDAWDAMDRRVVQLLHSTPKEGGSTEKNTRTKDMSTSGLVGFLSGRSSGNQWIDEYLWLNARVNGATNTLDGLKFEGNGGSAKWPVGDPKMNKLYSFADHGLTLLATVAINKTPKKSTPLLRLGLRLPWSQRNVGLWYDENNLWKGITKDGKENDASKVTSWKVGEEYQVILTMDKGESSVYIDGSYMGKLEQRTLHGSSSNSMSSFGRYNSGDTRPQKILFICFGACEKDEQRTEIHMAVKNVILYNRPFNSTEIEKLKKEEVAVGRTAVERGANNTLPSANTHNSSSSPAQPEVSHRRDTPSQDESVSKDPNSASEEHNSQHNSSSSPAQLEVSDPRDTPPQDESVSKGPNGASEEHNSQHNSSSSPAQPEVSDPPDTPSQDESVSKDPNGASEEHNSQHNSSSSPAQLEVSDPRDTPPQDESVSKDPNGASEEHNSQHNSSSSPAQLEVSDPPDTPSQDESVSKDPNGASEEHNSQNNSSLSPARPEVSHRRDTPSQDESVSKDPNGASEEHNSQHNSSSSPARPEVSDPPDTPSQDESVSKDPNGASEEHNSQNNSSSSPAQPEVSDPPDTPSQDESVSKDPNGASEEHNSQHNSSSSPAQLEVSDPRDTPPQDESVSKDPNGASEEHNSQHNSSSSPAQLEVSDPPDTPSQDESVSKDPNGASEEHNSQNNSSSSPAQLEVSDPPDTPSQDESVSKDPNGASEEHNSQNNSSLSPARPEVSHRRDTPSQEESVSKDPNGASEEHNSRPMKNSGDDAKLKPLTALLLVLLPVLFGGVTFCLVPKVVSYFYSKEKTFLTPQFITEPL